MKPILDTPFSGSAYPAYPTTPREQGGWTIEPESEHISGAFRVISEDNDALLLGNGEDPEKFWQIWSWDLEEEAA